MKKIIPILLMFALLAFPVFASINTLVADAASLSAEILRYTPNPAEPGDVLDVNILITNEGSNAARGVDIEFIDNYPFSIDSSDGALKEVPNLPGQESYVAKYKVRVDKDADEGTSYIKVRYKADQTTAYREALLAVDIETNDASIVIDKIVTTPETVKPGQIATIDVHVKNLADSKLRDVAVALETTKTVGSTTTELPFAPIEGSLERRIPELQADQSHVFSYSIIVEPGASSDVYKIPIEVTFSDLTGNDYTVNDEVGMIVNAKTDLAIYVEDIGLNQKNTQGDVVVRFVNRGLSEIKLLTVSIDQSSEFDILSSSDIYYIGNIDSDDYETAQFTIKANQNEFNIPIVVEYLDSLNNEFRDEITLPVKLNQPANGNGGSSAVIWVIIIVVAVIGFFIYRRRKNKKKRT